MKSDARNFTRKPLRGQALLILAQGAKLRGRTKDLSLGGICVVMPEPAPVGQVCTVALQTVHNGVTVQFMAQGKVAYSILSGTEGFQIGMQFTEIDATNNKALAELMI